MPMKKPHGNSISAETPIRTGVDAAVKARVTFGLAKMKALADAGFAQAVLPPHERPDVRALRALGFSGSDAEVIVAAGRDAPQLLAACSSAAAMWVANAATVSPSADTTDGRVTDTTAISS